MRVPKFRAWVKENKKMVFVREIDFMFGKVVLESYEQFFIDEVELMQFTGLKDKNGVEIYEGDIVKYKFSDHYGYVTDIVCYDYERACFGLMDDTGDYLYSFDWVLNKNMLESIEVIGNIWENKDLLGE